MKRIIIVIILLLSQIAHAGYPLQTDSSMSKGKGNFEIDLGVKGIQIYNKNIYYIINPQIDIDIGITDWAEIGATIEFMATFLNEEDTLVELGSPSFFIQINPFDKYDISVRLDYIPTWNNKVGHIIGGVLIKTFTIENYYLDLNVGSYANEIGNSTYGSIFGAVALRSEIPREYTQFELELIYFGNPVDSNNHTIGFLLALILTELQDTNSVIFGVGANWNIVDIIEWYIAIGIRFGYENE